MTLIDNVKNVCADKGMNIAELEASAGLAENSIYKWKKTDPGISKVNAVARVLDVTVDELLKE